MVTKAQETARANLTVELKKLQEDFYQDWVNSSLPEMWNEIPLMHPMNPDKVKVTLTLDEDMIKWFRKLGRGYQARVNSILRVYWQSLLTGQVQSHWDTEAVAPREHSMLEAMLAQKVAALKTSVTSSSDAEVTKELAEELEAVKKIHRERKK